MMSLSNARLFFPVLQKTMAVTRSDLISTLKSRGVKGQLSKMRKHDLQELVRQSAPADKRVPTGITLEPDEQAGGHCAGKLAKVCHDAYGDSDGDGKPDQKGGHYFQSFGKASASEKRRYKHTHEKSDMPTVNKQKGSGHSYRDFMTAEMRQNGGNMKAAVAKYHEQKGGHMVRADGTISDKENKKYAHYHKNLPNPAIKKAGSKRPEDDEFDDAFEAPESPPKPKPKTKAKRALLEPRLTFLTQSSNVPRRKKHKRKRTGRLS